jgi:hypothetical protein
VIWHLPSTIGSQSLSGRLRLGTPRGAARTAAWPFVEGAIQAAGVGNGADDSRISCRGVPSARCQYGLTLRCARHPELVAHLTPHSRTGRITPSLRRIRLNPDHEHFLLSCGTRKVPIRGRCTDGLAGRHARAATGHLLALCRTFVKETHAQLSVGVPHGSGR